MFLISFLKNLLLGDDDDDNNKPPPNPRLNPGLSSSTQNPTLNSTQNHTLNYAQNPTLNATRNPALNSTQNHTLNSAQNSTLNSTRNPTLNSLQNPTPASTRDSTLNFARAVKSAQGPSLNSARNSTLNSAQNPTLDYSYQDSIPIVPNINRSANVVTKNSAIPDTDEIYDIILNLLHHSSKDMRYISPRQIIDPCCQKGKITKHYNGAWEFKCPRCKIDIYFGFQIRFDSTRNNSNQQKLLKICPSIVRKHTEKKFGKNEDKDKDNGGDGGDGGDNNNDDTVCIICGGDKRLIMRPYNKHLCTVRIYMRCSCGNRWVVGIGKLDPDSERPVAKYYCKNCPNTPGNFIKYQLQNNNHQENEKPHRSDLCELCKKWTSCRSLFIQPETITYGLLLQNIEVDWNITEDGLLGSYTNQNEDFQFEIIPYVNIL